MTTRDATRDRSERSPGPERLQAAVDFVVARLRPDQIILFGSAARAEMSERSDLDLLVISDRGLDEWSPGHRRWTCEKTEDELDVLTTSRAEAEKHRTKAGDVVGAALEEGRTIYTRGGAEPVATGPCYVWNGTAMVRKTLFDPEHAAKFVEHAEEHWDTANLTPHSAIKCQQLQATMEHALKALITAQGRRVPHEHDLAGLWENVEKHGERIAAARDAEKLERLTRHAGDHRYARPPESALLTTWNTLGPTGLKILEHARRRVPALIEETGERLRREEAGEIVVRGAGRPAGGTEPAGPEARDEKNGGTERPKAADECGLPSIVGMSRRQAPQADAFGSEKKVRAKAL